MPPVNRYTVTHKDLAHFETCPRLLGVYAYLTAHPEARTPTVPREVEYVFGLDGLAYGSIGEAMTAEMLGNFEGDVDSKAVIAQSLEALRRRGAQITEQLRKEVERAVQEAQGQFTKVHTALQERYGKLTLLGRGKAHYGHVPGYAAPDYVAVAKDSSIILVDAKFQKKLTRDQVRQAEWYNAVATADALQVRWIPQVGEKMRGTIQASFNDPQECVLVNWSAKGDGILPVAERANATSETLREMWRTKHMGFVGLLPETDCGADCRCESAARKHNLRLKDGNRAIARPPVLSLGQAYVEGGVDLEGRGLANLATQVGGDEFLRTLRQLHLWGRRSKKPREAEERLAALLGIPEDRARELLRQGGSMGGITDKDAKFHRSWKPLVGDTLTMQGMKAQTTRTFAAAKDVHRLVRRANKFWDKMEG